MTFHDDVRGHFAREEAHFPTPSNLRPSAVAEAMDSEPIPRRQLRLAAAVAVVLAAAIVAGLLAGGALRRNQVLPSTSPKPTAPGTIANPNLIEIDAVDATSAFALFWKPPAGSGTETFWFTKTTDGGAHWSAPMKVGQLAPGEGDSGHHIHFTDGNNGIFYGGNTASVTHDGGRTWHNSGLKFLELVVATGRAPSMWVITYPCAKGTTPVCAYKVYLSKDGGRTWPQSWDLPGPLQPRFAITFGDGGLVITSNATGDMFVTTDGGLDWSTVHGRCAGATAAAYTATANGRELWQLCTGTFPNFAPGSLFVSENGGATWSKRTLPQAGSLSELYSPAAGTAFLLTAKTAMQVTRDAGRSWKAVNAASVYAQIIFTSATEAWAVQVDGSIWSTGDGGLTWTRLPAQPKA
jgi:photosystem II stability/assembly factor-like uncharacterized protein